MKIFMTGATGFIGKSIVRRLIAEKQYEITALLLPDEPEALLEGMPVRIVRGDITRAESLEDLMEGLDTVIHLAGAVGYGQTMQHCLLINRDGTANIAREAVRSGVKRFCHFSSVSVYGRVPNIPIPESFPMKKTGDPYGDTKIDAENMLRELAAKGKLELTVLRPTVIYGPGDVMFLPKLIENVMSGRARIIGTGDNTVDLIHVADIADFVFLVLENEKSVGETYNLTHPDNPSWRELMDIVTDVFGIPKIKRHLPYKAALVVATLLELLAAFKGIPPLLTRYSVRVVGRQYHYLTDKCRQELGFYPKISLAEGVRKELTALGDGEHNPVS